MVALGFEVAGKDGWVEEDGSERVLWLCFSFFNLFSLSRVSILFSFFF